VIGKKFPAPIDVIPNDVVEAAHGTLVIGTA